MSSVINRPLLLYCFTSLRMSIHVCTLMHPTLGSIPSEIDLDTEAGDLIPLFLAFGSMTWLNVNTISMSARDGGGSMIRHWRHRG